MEILGIWRKSPTGEPTTHHSEPTFTIGNLALWIGPAVTVLENDRTKLVYNGPIFDRTPAELLENPIALDRAYGLYTYVKAAKHGGEVVIGTDFLGYSPLFYSDQGDSFVFGTSLSLLKHRLRRVSANYEALEEILQIGDIVGEKTLVKEVKRLRPGTKITIDERGVSQTQFWFPETPPTVDPAAYVTENNELLREAMELTAKDDRPKVIPLTGGEDSRRLAVAAHDAGLSVSFATQVVVGLGGFDYDVKIAEQVAKLLGAPHEVTPMPPEPIFSGDVLMRDYWLAFESSYHEWAIPLLAAAPANSLVYDGIVGDITVNGHFFRLYPGLLNTLDDLDGSARIITGPDRGFGFNKKMCDSTVFERVREELERYMPSHHFTTFYFLFNHTRKNIGIWIQLFNLFGHRAACPFMYYPHFMQSLSLRPEVYVKTLMQKACIAEMNPAAARIPSTRDEPGDEYKIDFGAEWRHVEKFRSTRWNLRPDVKAMFPSFKRHLLAYRLATAFGISSLRESLTWVPSKLDRISTYFDWLEDADEPDWPVAPEGPKFLKDRIASSSLSPTT
jgi:hypothetical protein